MKKVLFIMFALLQLSACVEIRDKKGDPATAGSAAPAPMVKEKKFEDLVIDEEMYVYDNRILNAADLDQAQKDNAYFHKRPAHDFEFHFDHLTISENGTLYTLGNNVRLHVQDLEVTSGLITTFPENQKADHDKIARPGGHILVDVQNPKGFLKIALRGEAGSNGLP
ncbi:MAG TPA: hypothetical protein VN132_10515, partial [Bdellovibrio sp.]|nr:hypothetical protein [Bdellovibrio sp.]